ncbi:MAG: DUF58 domain-containing protein [Gammaproteobacteria bacterium]|nr:DUF58 domain-containing protein [Gammaproteobacteria bacterium]MBT8150873.1 DUF58 domain-containing protein [Gammaproteobacteria bacterium]NND38033.1 DUF58 domain-containing protein [Pseudomonadales bacterium]NNM10630.1 DUF58 domain-containing protein [Pseudomonadales bacterium]RZV60017.1 MAG: DUF58 domain-containing protein [Pseudomonadales bacterium]
MRIPSDLYQKRYRDRRGRRGRIGWQQKWRAWLDRRIPAAHEHHLSHRNIFIFPSRAGLVYAAFIGMLLLVAINFENSAVYALVFLLSGMLVVSILHTFANLSGLQITGRSGESAFAGRHAVFKIILSAQERVHYGVQLSWQEVSTEHVDVEPGAEQRLSMRFRTGPRGICNPGRVKIQTSYPLGLVTAWTWVDLDMHAVVYPYPDKNAGSPAARSAYHESGSREQTGSDDFFGLRAYVPGDSLRSVAWKTYARNDQLASKQFVDYIDNRLWLEWNAAHGSDEQRLAQLCHWALLAEGGHHEYGLQLPGEQLSPSRGRRHLEELLTRLAMFRLPDAQSVVMQNTAEQDAAPQSAAGQVGNDTTPPNAVEFS